MSESSQKLDLIRQALEIHRQQLPAESSIASDLKAEIEATQTMSPGSMTFTNLGDPFSTSSSQPGMNRSASQRSSTSFSRASSVTGKLEVKYLLSVIMCYTLIRPELLFLKSRPNFFIPVWFHEFFEKNV